MWRDAISKFIDGSSFQVRDWYVHFASCFYNNIYCIMGCYYTLCHNTYGYSLLFYKAYHEEGECWIEKEQILETYSAQLQKSWNSTEVTFGINKNYWAKKIPEGAHTLASRGIRPFCIMLLYQHLLHYGLLLHIISQYLWLFSLILQGLPWRGGMPAAGILARKGANIGKLFCTAPKILKLHETYFWN